MEANEADTNYSEISSCEIYTGCREGSTEHSPLKPFNFTRVPIKMIRLMTSFHKVLHDCKVPSLMLLNYIVTGHFTLKKLAE